MATTTIKSGFYATPDETIYFVTPAGDAYYVQGPDDPDIPVLYRERLPEGAEPIGLDPDLAAEYLEALRAASVRAAGGDSDA